MWEILSTGAWIVAAGIFLWLAWDFYVVNRDHSEEFLLSSREGVDELFTSADKTKGRH